jgi:hypothetical protein
MGINMLRRNRALRAGKCHKNESEGRVKKQTQNNSWVNVS